MKRRTLLLLTLAWGVGVVLPLGSFRTSSPAFRTAFDFVFHTHASHVLMHSFLYAVLAALVFAVLHARPRPVWRAAVATFAVVALVSLVQEGFQLRYKGIAPAFDEYFDTAVNLNGIVLGILLSVMKEQTRQPQGGGPSPPTARSSKPTP